MPRRLPAGNRVVGHHGRDDPGRVLGRGALVGVRGLVDLGALDGPPIVRPPNRRRSVQSPAISENTAPIIPMTDLLLGSTCTTRLRCLSSRSECSCTLLVRSLTWYSRGNPDGPGCRPRLLRHLGRLGAEALYPGGDESVEPPYEPEVALGEHGLQDTKRGTLFLPCRRVAGGAVHQMRDAALPRVAWVRVDDV